MDEPLPSPPPSLMQRAGELFALSRRTFNGMMAQLMGVPKLPGTVPTEIAPALPAESVAAAVSAVVPGLKELLALASQHQAFTKLHNPHWGALYQSCSMLGGAVAVAGVTPGAFDEAAKIFREQIEPGLNTLFQLREKLLEDPEIRKLAWSFETVLRRREDADLREILQFAKDHNLAARVNHRKFTDFMDTLDLKAPMDEIRQACDRLKPEIGGVENKIANAIGSSNKEQNKPLASAYLKMKRGQEKQLHFELSEVCGYGKEGMEALSLAARKQREATRRIIRNIGKDWEPAPKAELELHPIQAIQHFLREPIGFTAWGRWNPYGDYPTITLPFLETDQAQFMRLIFGNAYEMHWQVAGEQAMERNTFMAELTKRMPIPEPGRKLHGPVEENQGQAYQHRMELLETLEPARREERKLTAASMLELRERAAQFQSRSDLRFLKLSAVKSGYGLFQDSKSCGSERADYADRRR